MGNYQGTTKLYDFRRGTALVDKVFKGSDPVYARMSLNFDEQGGSSVTNKIVYYQDSYGTLPSSTRTYYDFDGWYTAITGGSNITSTSIVNEIDNHTLYARWLESPSSPTGLTYVDNTQTSLIYEVSNPNPYSVRMYFEVNDSTPDANYEVVPANTTTEIEITGLSAGTFYTSYFRCYSTQSGQYSSSVSSYNTTQSAGATNWVFQNNSLNGSAYSYNTSVSKPPENFFCPTSGSVDTWLTSAYPPGNYSVGHVIRVYTSLKSGSSCGYWWFIAQ